MHNKPLGMAWYKFLIYFALIAGAVINIAYGVNYLNGGIYEIQSDGRMTAEQVYACYGAAVQVVDIIFGLSLIAIAVLEIILRNKLAKHKPDSLRYVWIVYSLLAVVPFIYSVVIAVITSQPLVPVALGALAIGILLLLLNDRYFVKRAHLLGIKLKFARQPCSATCPRCGNETPSDSKFCQRCGFSLVEEEPKAVAKESQPVVCAVCGCNSPSGSKFCEVCGSPIESAIPSPSENEKFLPTLSYADEQFTPHPNDVFGKDFRVQKPADDVPPVAAKANTLTEVTYMGVDLCYIENLGWNFAFGQNEYWFPTLQAAKSAITEFTQNIIPKYCVNNAPHHKTTKE